MKFEVVFKLASLCFLEHHLTVLVKASQSEKVFFRGKVILSNALQECEDALSLAWVAKELNPLCELVRRQFHINIAPLRWPELLRIGWVLGNRSQEGKIFVILGIDQVFEGRVKGGDLERRFLGCV